MLQQVVNSIISNSFRNFR